MSTKDLINTLIGYIVALAALIVIATNRHLYAEECGEIFFAVPFLAYIVLDGVRILAKAVAIEIKTRKERV